MPYCEDCAKYWTPSAMNTDGTCPTCGRLVEAPERQSTITAKNLDLKKLAVGEDGDEDDVMVLLVVYLGWRVVDLFV